MIIMPVWIFDENDNEYTALLGSEPKIDAKREILPKNCVTNIIYAPVAHESGAKFALVTLDKTKVPENIKKMIPNDNS